MSKPSAWWVAVVASGVVTGCNEGSSVPLASGNQLPACETFSTALTLLDRMDQPAYVFNVGEDIFANMRVTNNTPFPAAMRPAYTCGDIAIVDVFSQATNVWSSPHAVCIAAAPDQLFDPYESVHYRVRLGDIRGSGSLSWPWPWPSGTYIVNVHVGHVMDSQRQWVDCSATLDKQASFNIL